ncbi:hypothetical protein [Halorussus sp. AFM4]|uniref:hypothetical protein n=1 Tax=Halorussus sp. AFM4 TaxID=3421651 RepID=UPI003EC01406
MSSTTDRYSESRLESPPDLDQLKQRAEALKTRYSEHVIGKSTPTEGEPADLAAVFARVDGLVNLRTAISCPHCPWMEGVSDNSIGYALVDTSGESLSEWFIGDRCPRHADHVPANADIIVQYETSPTARRLNALKRNARKIARLND